MSQGTKIVAVVLFVLFVGTGIYYLTLSPAPSASPAPAKATEPPAARPAPVRDPGSITMNPPVAPGATPPVAPVAMPPAVPGPAPVAPKIADPLAANGGASGTVPNPARVTLGPGGAPVSVMPPLTVSRPAAPIAPVSPVSGETAPGVPAVRPTLPAPVVATTPALPTAATGSAREHVVASGETLSSIAARYLGSESRWSDLAKANPEVNPNSMRVGTKLRIPAGSGSTPSPAAEARSTSTATVAPPAGKADEYVVKAGDTLTGIARQTLGNADWESIYEANRSVIGSNPAALKVGMRLSIPKRS